MPEGKQESKPMTPPPVITPEIIPETLPLQRPKPAFNTVPRPGSCMNKAHTQDLKADLYQAALSTRKTDYPSQDFKTTRITPLATHQFIVTVTQLLGFPCFQRQLQAKETSFPH